MPSEIFLCMVNRLDDSANSCCRHRKKSLGEKVKKRGGGYNNRLVKSAKSFRYCPEKMLKRCCGNWSDAWSRALSWMTLRIVAAAQTLQRKRLRKCDGKWCSDYNLDRVPAWLEKSGLGNLTTTTLLHILSSFWDITIFKKLTPRKIFYIEHLRARFLAIYGKLHF